MRVVACSSPSHDVLTEKWFLPTLGPGFEPDVFPIAQHCPSAEFEADGWHEQMNAKIQTVLSAFEADDEVVVFSDVDVRFFEGFTPAVARTLLGRDDIVFQQGGVDGSVCAGFFIFRVSDRFGGLLRRWSDEFASGAHVGDESALNAALEVRRSYLGSRSLRLGDRVARGTFRAITTVAPRRSHSIHGVRWRALPRTVWNPGLSHPGVWTQGSRLDVPQGILVHHANHCVGVDDKLAQLAAVDAIVAVR
ncbi:MAG: putative nucleotide-diphospho-sugar transferase [Acidimicrobiales bacterium]